jgi:hypothetical protein
VGAGESRDYHLGVQVGAAGVGQEMLAARVSLVASSPEGQQVLGQGLVRATWTEDEALSTRINPRVALYTGQAELAEAIQEGLEASKRGMTRRPPRGWAGRWRWRIRRGTGKPRGCCREWSMLLMRRPGRCG